MRTPNYKISNTTVAGMKAACKALDLDAKGSKMQLFNRLADAWQDGLRTGDEWIDESIYACWYASPHNR